VRQWVDITGDHIAGGLEQKLKFKEQITMRKTPFGRNEVSYIHTIPCPTRLR
jgi:hypothetical protein